MNCKEISADWAAQRIRGLSLASAIRNTIWPPSASRQPRENVIKTLVTQFRYPRKGPGMLWEAVAEKVEAAGGRIVKGIDVGEVTFDREAGRWRVAGTDAGGRTHEFDAAHVISSMPIRDMVAALMPCPAPQVREAAASLRYRDFLIVALIVKDRQVFDDNWIYVHDPNVQVGRIQNFKSWSPEMVPDPDLNCYGMEYFCNEGDATWAMADPDLIALAGGELVKLGLASADDLIDGHVIRQAKAYPVYDDGYERRVDLVRRALAEHYPTIHLVGRNGMHKYNNQDHAMMTAMLTAENILAGRMVHDVWAVNQDAEYHESGQAGARREATSGERLVPRKASR